MHHQVISMTELWPPDRPVRTNIDDTLLTELADSMKRVGVLLPLIVERINGGYMVVDGHRRFLAAEKARLAAVPCVVREEGDPPPQAMKVQANLYREDMTAVEEAAFYAELYRDLGQDVDRVCELVRHPRAYVEKRLLLMDGDSTVLQAVAAKEISLGVAEELNKYHTHEAAARKRNAEQPAIDAGRARDEKDRRYHLSWAVRVGATKQNVVDWRKSIEMGAEFNPAPAADGAPHPQTVAVEPVKQVCYCCRSDRNAHLMEFWFVHSYCRQQDEAAAAEVERFREKG